MKRILVLGAALLWLCTLPALAQVTLSPTGSTKPTLQPATPTTPGGGTSAATATPATGPLLPPGIILLPQTVADHVIVPRDTLQVISWTPNQVIVNTVVTVATDGTIALPYAGTVNVAGSRIGDLQAGLAPIYTQRYPTALVYIMLAGAKLPPGTPVSAPLTLDAATQTVSPAVSLLTTPLAPKDELQVRVVTGEPGPSRRHRNGERHLDYLSAPPRARGSVKDLNLLTLRDQLLKRYRFYYPRCRRGGAVGHS